MELSLLNLICAFGGGLLGAAVGGTNAFILTGFLAISGGAIALATGSTVVLDWVAFGCFLGPHIMFQGGVAATAFAQKIKKVTNGADINKSMHSLESVSVLLVGGIFGILGLVIRYILTKHMGVTGNPLESGDPIAMTVVIGGVLARLLFGKTGIIGENFNKSVLPDHKKIIYFALFGAGVGMVVGGLALQVNNLHIANLNAGYIPVITFGVSAVSLILLQIGLKTPVTHHVTITSSNAAFLSGNIFVGILVGLISAVLGEIIAAIFNSRCDSHIDPPACVIAIITSIMVFVY